MRVEVTPPGMVAWNAVSNTADLRHAGAEQRARRADALQVGRVVERRELDAVLDAGEHLVVDRTERGTLAAVDDAVPDGVDVGDRAELDPGRGRHQPAQHVVDRRAVVAQRASRALRRPALGAQREQRLAADPLDHAARQSRSAFASIASRSVAISWNLSDERRS